MNGEFDREKIQRFFPPDEVQEIINLAAQDMPGAMDYAALRLDAYADRYLREEPVLEPKVPLAKGMKATGAVLVFAGVYTRDVIGLMSGLGIFAGARIGQDVRRQKLLNRHVLVNGIRVAILNDYSDRVRRRAASYDQARD